MKKYLLAGVALGSLWSASALSADLSLLAKPPVPNWNGWYSGTQFGMDCLNASHDNASTSNSSSSSQTTVVLAPGTTITVPATNTTSTISSSTAQGKNCGAKLALYGGYNMMWGNNAVVGAQVEGGVANVRVNMTSVGNSISNSTSTSISPGGTTFTFSSTSSTLSNSTGTDTLDNRWQLSALARIGVLLDPVDLVYVIGGYTYGRFDYLNNFAFGINGGTIGGGWERQFVRGWTVRIEGRYTKFASKEVTTGFSNTSTTSSSSTITSTTSTTSNTDRFSANVASALLGVSYYFGTY